jgi:hypothetical protein
MEAIGANEYQSHLDIRHKETRHHSCTWNIRSSETSKKFFLPEVEKKVKDSAPKKTTRYHQCGVLYRLSADGIWGGWGRWGGV